MTDTLSLAETKAAIRSCDHYAKAGEKDLSKWHVGTKPIRLDPIGAILRSRGVKLDIVGESYEPSMPESHENTELGVDGSLFMTLSGVEMPKPGDWMDSCPLLVKQYLVKHLNKLKGEHL